MTHPSLLGLCGSLRSGSVNRQLLREAARLFGTTDYVEGDLNLPLYNGDDEDRDGRPESVEMLVAQIAAADAVLIATPEYNSGMSGVLKNALDWISRSPDKALTAKPVALLSATAGRTGGARAQIMLRNALVSFRPRLALAPEVMIADASNAFDDDGRLNSERYVRAVTTLMDALRQDIGR